MSDIYAQHGVDHQKLREGLRKGDFSYLIEHGQQLEEVFAHRWILENATRRGITVFALLRMMIDFRSRLDS